eukprot:TRINITY_DN1567_c0_g1_i1.p1 TRINITY_DN1567_c0_g1~~TRINITY_DN1567_c0_g1_i1.p1  ORF type:complete len:372 (-),score=72.22 TRINITY_DN1567_c0_g1_i1:896-2011(-)
MKQCARRDCENEATFQCPTCKKIPGCSPTYFCSKVCFKQEWASHKNIHAAQVLANRAKSNSNGLPSIFAGFQFTGPLRPGTISEKREVPDHINKPDYADHPEGFPQSEYEDNGEITVYTPEEIEKIRTVCRLGAEVLAAAGNFARPGVTTDEVDAIVHEASIERDCYPSPLNYKTFPKSCCTSVNEVICHGIPDSRVLQDGDILNVDVSVYHDGFHADLNETWLIGNVDEDSKQLVQATYESLELAMAKCRPGVLYRDMGTIISKHVNKQGFSVVRTYCGHGVGRLFHGAPSVPHYKGNRGRGVMKPGHVFTIEPMINRGNWRDKLWPDDWTSATVDGKRSAQFEHTILITETGHEVLTRRTTGTYIDRFF